ncbi:hypothetical protein [Mesorhizobium sp. M0199]|uniref:hypothetical protein n=1 Tax=Mesorhizobium sp. M0199 TaxID=2956911 RepID=UPI003334D6CB
MFKFGCAYVVISFALLISPCFAASSRTSNDFNKYVIRAVEHLMTNRAGKGYADVAFTQDLGFGDFGMLKAQKPPQTMCVAASLEALVEALNFYADDTQDFSPFHHIPKVSWERLRPRDFRGQMWGVANSPSQGSGDAFDTFGMGGRAPFSELAPGNFINFNRNNGGGSAGVFLGYIDRNGTDLSGYSDQVSGFKYFSAQGKGRPDGGLGFRWGFFQGSCPVLTDGRKRDCGILRAEHNNDLMGGYVLPPWSWDKKKATDYVNESNAVTDPAMIIEAVFNSDRCTGVTIDD